MMKISLKGLDTAGLLVVLATAVLLPAWSGEPSTHAGVQLARSSGTTSWAEKPIVQLLGVLGWVVGIMSGYLQWRSYRQQRRLEGGYRILLERAQRDWRGQYTEAQVNRLTAQFQQLQRGIGVDIPRQARRVFLTEQRRTLADSIAELSQQYDRTTEELGHLAGDPGLDNRLRELIENEILPAYLKRQRQHWVLLFFVALGLLLALFPWLPETLQHIIIASGPSQGCGEALYYIVGLAAATLVAFSIPATTARRMPIPVRLLLLILGAALLSFWVAYVGPVTAGYARGICGGTVAGSVRSIIAFAAGIRLLWAFGLGRG